MTTDHQTTESKPSRLERQSGMAITGAAILMLLVIAVWTLSH
jgi:hypothetical protein